MDRTEPTEKERLLVQRGFHPSRLEGEWTASAYEILVPQIRRPALPPGPVVKPHTNRHATAATGA